MVGSGWASWHSEGWVRLGEKATVWDGEINAMRRGLEDALQGDVLLLSDSQAAIKAVKKAGMTGKARTRELKLLMDEIEKKK